MPSSPVRVDPFRVRWWPVTPVSVLGIPASLGVEGEERVMLLELLALHVVY